MPSLVTVVGDGFRNYVELPNGTQINLGAISVLKLVTSLVSRASMCRKILDSFLKNSYATLAVDLGALEKLVTVPRSRWAAYEDPSIPFVRQDSCRGPSMNSSQALMATLSSIEKHLASFQEDQEDTQEKTAKLQSLVSSLGEEPQTLTAKEAGVDPLSGIERVLAALAKKGSASKEDCEALSLAVSKLASLGKTAAVEESTKEELDLYIENDGRMYKSKLKTLGSLVRKKKEGKYNNSLAVKLWLLWVTEGAKMYFREFPETPKDTFSKELCLSLAKEIEQREEKLIDLGEYEGMKFASQEQQEASEEEQEETQETQEKTASVLSPASQLKILQSKPPKKEQEGDLWVISIFSPVVKKYIPMSERADEASADVDFEFWDKEHTRIIKALKEAASNNKEASVTLTASDVSEALAHSVMAKVEAALKVVEASDKANTLVAKKDLGKITSDLTKLIEASDLSDESIQNPLKRLAGMADQVHSYFA
jgi:hypothetical protein